MSHMVCNEENVGYEWGFGLNKTPNTGVAGKLMVSLAKITNDLAMKNLDCSYANETGG